MTEPFGTIVVDPPWDYKVWSDKGKERTSPDKHYGVMTLEDICALPIGSVCATDCTLLLWATSPLLCDAMRVIERWGFTYKSALYWLKMSRLGVIQIGCGYHSRACVEPLLVATRGNPRAPLPADRPYSAFFEECSSLLVSPRGRHSAKPHTQYDIAEGYEGPYAEIFSRYDNGAFPDRDNWTFLGNEINGRDIRDELRGLAGASCLPS